MSRIVLGIDQSYSRIGFAAVTRTKVIKAESVDLRKLRNATQKRLCVKELVRHWIERYEPTAIVVERVRLFTGNRIAVRTIHQLAAMTAVIVDSAYCHQAYNPKALEIRRRAVPVFSADTRAWKKGVLGDSRAEKSDAVDWLAARYRVLDHDAADAACMARYAFVDGAKLQRER